MEFRLLEDSDYETLCKWWKWWRFSAPPKDALPHNGKGGIMVSRDGVDVCAGFIYFTNSTMCWIEFIVSNPEVKENRKEVITFLINELCVLAKRAGVKVAYTSLKSPSLINNFSECEFITGSSNCTEMIKVL